MNKPTITVTVRIQGYCATCKHWEQSSGHCLLATTDSGRPLCKDSLAVAEDAESYMAWLVTKADFGCVQYEAAE